MIDIKTSKEIEKMAYGGKILSDVLYATLAQVQAGVTELELDKFAEKMIRQRGGESGFKKVPGYKHTICASTNNVVVHGIPKNHKLKEGDIIGIDCGVFYEGFHTDMSETVIVKGPKGLAPRPEVEDFLAAGKEALLAGIAEAKPGKRVGHISQAIQEIVEGKGYTIVENLVGHGVGRELHEEPEIPGKLMMPLSKTPILQVGMTIAVEVIYNMGEADVMYANDGWTIKTQDGSLSGVFERTIAITPNGPEFLTP